MANSENGIAGEELPYEQEKLWRLLDARRWREGVSEVELRLRHAPTPERRAFYHMFLATLYKCLLRESRRKSDDAAATSYRDLIERSYLSATAESPRDVNPRVGFAEFLLSQHKRPGEALVLLANFSSEDFAFHGDLEFQDHKRLALRGLALVSLGRLDESLSAYLESYSARFRETLPSAYKNALWIMMKRKLRIPAEHADAIVTSLAQFKYSRPDNLARIRLGLIEGFVPPPTPR
jgi:hypothetical protein